MEKISGELWRHLVVNVCGSCALVVIFGEIIERLSLVSVLIHDKRVLQLVVQSSLSRSPTERHPHRDYHTTSST